MTLSAPVPYSPDLEDVEPNEAEVISGINGTFDSILTTTAEDYGRAVRAVHAKAHAVLEGTFTVHGDLPPELRQGLFASPGDHKAYLRLSTNAGDILDDAISLPRGVALKVLDVAGERLAGSEGGAQDFVMVNGKVFQAKTAEQFLGSLKLLAKTTDRAEGVKKVASAVLRGVTTALGAVGLESPALNALGGAPNAEPLGETYYSVTPFRFGDYVAKFSLAPVAPFMTALTGQTIKIGGRKDAIRETLQEELRATDAVWAFRVQLCRDLDKAPVEDPTIEWDEDVSPFQTVATLTVRAQDSLDPERMQRVNEDMRFSVWTGLAAHQPLGNINRARRDTYQHSAEFRARTNRCPIHEPS